MPSLFLLKIVDEFDEFDEDIDIQYIMLIKYT
jgi:hypothetical protein